MAGKAITLLPSVVVKTDLPGHEGSVARQARNLRRAKKAGFNVVPFILNGNTLAQQRIVGPSLHDLFCQGLLSEEHLRGLAMIQEQQLEKNCYIGDLNWRNLHWQGGEWIIIDCGSVRNHYSTKKLQKKLERQAKRKWKGAL